MDAKIERFKKKCNDISADTGINVGFYTDAREKAAFEDDGVLHIVRHGCRACFDVDTGQSSPPSLVNDNIEAVCKALKIKANPLWFCEEEEEKDDTCPHCGRSFL